MLGLLASISVPHATFDLDASLLEQPGKGMGKPQIELENKDARWRVLEKERLPNSRRDDASDPRDPLA
jgi:hypothetical protein